ncbi:MAG TPA: hypothetical protein VMG36_07295, partial [Thermoplasmata archaeon]|nr:hypothetical protein [Thermoplasmata archaeon]
NSVIGHIEALHFSFAALSTAVMPTVPVGGYASAARNLATPKFLQALCPMYSYLTAWSLAAAGHPLTETTRIDAFESKQTQAWSRVCRETTPEVYFKGDEVDPVVCLADIIAFATDRLLYRAHRKLEPAEIDRLWSGRCPTVTNWLVGRGNVDKVTWATDEQIDHRAYVRHPIVFLLRDRPEVYARRADGQEPLSLLLQGGEGFESAVRLATVRRGCLKFFEPFQDPPMVRDHDIFVYAGPRSAEVVGLYRDMHDIEVYTFREAREVAGRLNL